MLLLAPPVGSVPRRAPRRLLVAATAMAVAVLASACSVTQADVTSTTADPTSGIAQGGQAAGPDPTPTPTTAAPTSGPAAADTAPTVVPLPSATIDQFNLDQTIPGEHSYESLWIPLTFDIDESTEDLFFPWEPAACPLGRPPQSVLPGRAKTSALFTTYDPRFAVFLSTGIRAMNTPEQAVEFVELAEAHVADCESYEVPGAGDWVGPWFVSARADEPLTVDGVDAQFGVHQVGHDPDEEIGADDDTYGERRLIVAWDRYVIEVALTAGGHDSQDPIDLDGARLVEAVEVQLVELWATLEGTESGRPIPDVARPAQPQPVPQDPDERRLIEPALLEATELGEEWVEVDRPPTMTPGRRLVCAGVENTPVDGLALVEQRFESRGDQVDLWIAVRDTAADSAAYIEQRETGIRSCGPFVVGSILGYGTFVFLTVPATDLIGAADASFEVRFELVRFSGVANRIESHSVIATVGRYVISVTAPTIDQAVELATLAIDRLPTSG